jgi:hypothetical protein
VTLAQQVGLFLLAVSPFAAAAVGRRLHDRANCPVCQREREQRASRRRHPSRLPPHHDQTAYYDDWDNL